jgi:hypothetical protein
MIKSFAKFGKTDLHTAARAGALCMVVRSRDWRPKAGDEAQYGVCRVPSATSLCNRMYWSWSLVKVEILTINRFVLKSHREQTAEVAWKTTGWKLS